MKGKYVIFESAEFGLEYPVLLPGVNHFINHKEIKVNNDKPISAGFFSLDNENDDVFVYGISVSLKISSRPEDAKLIKQYLTKQ